MMSTAQAWGCAANRARSRSVRQFAPAPVSAAVSALALVLSLLSVRVPPPLPARLVGADARASSVRRIGGVSTILAMALLAGCGSLPRATESVQLELLSSQPLTLANDCQAQGTFRVEFTVLRDGAVSAVKPAAAPACVQAGLAAWVQSFRYAPTGMDVAVPHAVEWLMVGAPRG